MTDQPAICTIIAKNYVAHARVLVESFLAKHPGGECFVLVIDDFEGYIDPALESFRLVRLDELGISDARSLCFKYNVTELATAVKATLIKHLLDRLKVGSLLYLDPDILVTGSLLPLFDKLERSPAILTPHLDTDYPDDGKYPDDRHILISGIFNLGFLGIRKGPWADRFLAWLEPKLMSHCIIDHKQGYFVDQRFFDLALAIFPEMEIERNVGYNVAYWNMHSRFLRVSDDAWVCNGEALRFFHFSDYKPESAEVISGHMNRYLIADRPDMVPIFELYHSKLIAHGYEEVRKWPYGYARFGDGRIVSDDIRRIYRESEGLEAKKTDPFRDQELSQKSVRIALRNRVDRKFDRIRGWVWKGFEGAWMCLKILGLNRLRVKALL